MRYTVSSQQLDYFLREGFVEFETLYTQEESHTLRTLLDQALQKRLGANPKPDREKLKSGYDLQREDPALLKALSLSMLGQMGAVLFKHKKLRIAFLQYFPLYGKTASIAEISSMTDIAGAVLINLSGDKIPHLPYLPHAVGSGTFYDLHFPLSFSELDAPFLFIAFAGDKARYILQETDPHTHALKKLGYGVGDRITIQTHPFII